jgi:hypothetical protein
MAKISRRAAIAGAASAATLLGGCDEVPSSRFNMGGAIPYGTPAPPPPPPQTGNPIGINFASGGGDSTSYEGFPIFQDRVREARFGTPFPSFNSAGWPTSNFQLVLYEGGTPTGLSWIEQGTNYFSCGYTGTGNETISAAQGTISNVVNNGGVVTFRLTVNSNYVSSAFGFTLTNVTGPITNIFAYLPEYNSNTAYSAISLFTTEAVNHYSQYSHIRFMEWVNADGCCGPTLSFTADAGVGATSATLYAPFPYNTGTYLCIISPTTAQNPQVQSLQLTKNSTAVTFTTALTIASNGLVLQNSSQNRHTAANTPMNSWGYNPGVGAGATWSGEANPLEWCVDFCIACKIGMYLNFMAGDDGTWSLNVLQMVQAKQAAAGVSLPIYIEYGNELWNGGYSSGSAAAFFAYAQATGLYDSSLSSAYPYYSFLYHRLASTIESVFGSGSIGTQVFPVMAWQSGGNGVYWFYLVSNYYTAQGWTLSADVSYIAQAPYMNTNYTSSEYNNTVAQIEATLNSMIPDTTPYGNLAEHFKCFAVHWGLDLVSYEGGWQTNGESSSLVNGGAAIMDSGMTGVMTNYYNAIFNSGFTRFTQFESGVCTLSSNLDPVDELSTNYTALVINGYSPRFAAITAYASGYPTITRNNVTTVGAIVQGNCYADSNSGANPTLAGGYQNTPYYVGTGLITYSVYSGVQRSTALLVNFTNSGGSAGTTGLEYGSVAKKGFSTGPSGTAIPVGTGNVSVGTFTLQVGWNYVTLGTHGTGQSSITVNSLAFN